MADNLLKSKRFLPLLITQFFGALNDNLFKNALLTMVAFRLADKSAILSNVIAGLFILPFFLFSATAGQIADKYNRATLARVLKFVEVGLMLTVALVFYTENITLLIILLALMGTQSAFFGPIKYALLPQLLGTNELIRANAYIEASTYMAILVGLVLGTMLPINIAIILLIILAGVGAISSLKIPTAPAPRPQLSISTNIFKAIAENLNIIRRKPVVFQCILGATWFWSIGAFVAVQIYPLASNTLHASAEVITFFLLLFSIGVALGSLACEKILKGMIHATYVPIATLGMGICLYMIYHLTKNYPTPEHLVTLKNYITAPHAIGIALSLFMLAFCGGLYIVPINAIMQKTAPKAYTASVIAGNNIFNALGMVAVAIIAVALLSLGISVPQLFLIFAVVDVVIFIHIIKKLPSAILRSILQIILYVLYRVRLEGIKNVQRAGKRVVIIANHTSLLDGLLLTAFIPDKITFAINRDWASKWYVRCCGYLVKLLPIDPMSPFSIREMIEAVKAGHKLMIFPEGRITTTGGLMKVYDGAGIIAKQADARILPIHIDGAEFSNLSYMKNKLNTRLFPKIKMSIMRPSKIHIPQDITGREQRNLISLKLYDIMANAIYKSADIDENIFTSLIASAQKYGKNQLVVEDTMRTPISYKQLIIMAKYIGVYYQQILSDITTIGVILPNNLLLLTHIFALIAVDKIPAILNNTLTNKEIIKALEKANIKTIITSHQFISEDIVQELKQHDIKILDIKDIEHHSHSSSFKSFKPQRKRDDTAVILFERKGNKTLKPLYVTHKNLQAQRYQLHTVLPINQTDVLFNILPLHTLQGLTVGTLFPILSGVKTFIFPKATQSHFVSELIYDTNATILYATDESLQKIIDKAHPYDFYNLKYAIIGEKLTNSTATLWQSKTSTRILEGLSVNNISAMLSLNTPMFAKPNTFGRLLPGITYKLGNTTALALKGDNIIGEQEWNDIDINITIDDNGYLIKDLHLDKAKK